MLRIHGEKRKGGMRTTTKKTSKSFSRLSRLSVLRLSEVLAEEAAVHLLWLVGGSQGLAGAVVPPREEHPRLGNTASLQRAAAARRRLPVLSRGRDVGRGGSWQLGNQHQPTGRQPQPGFCSEQPAPRETAGPSLNYCRSARKEAFSCVAWEGGVV